MVGVITRDSVRQALRGGIVADQIIGYLTQHAHPQMLTAENKHPLPPTVVDQIKLWEMERNRLTYTEGVLYSQFLSQVLLLFYLINLSVHSFQNFKYLNRLLLLFLKFYINCKKKSTH